MCTVDKMLIKGIRSFSPENTNVVEFYRPLTLIVGANGAGKTTVIECLKQACTGELPPNTRSGQSFVHDPKVAHETEVKAQIKLRFVTSNGQPVVVVRSFQLTQKKQQLQFKTLDSILQTINAETREKQVTTYRCADLDKLVPALMGVSKAVLENVIFVHQEESNWPLAEGKVLKEKFDDIFAATKYTKALESLRKLRLDKSHEIKEKKLQLDHLRTHRDNASKLQEEMRKAQEVMASQDAQIQELSTQIHAKSALVAQLQSAVSELHRLRQEASVLSARLDEMSKTVAAKKAQLTDEYDESREELEQFLAQFDVKIEQAKLAAARHAREIQAKKHEIASLNDHYNREVMRHSRLQAEKSAHERNVVERDRFIAELAGRLGVNLPGAAAAIAGTGSLSGSAVTQFQRDLAGRVAEREAALRSIKEANRRRDEELAREVDNVTRTITRKQEELRMKRQQVTQNAATVDALYAQQDNLGVSDTAVEAAEQTLNEISDRLRTRNEEQAKARLDEKLLTEKREIDAIVARLGELRQERDRLAGANESTTRMRMKQSELRNKEEGLQGLLRNQRSKLMALLGNPADLPSVEQLKEACERAVQRLRQNHATLTRSLTEAQAKEGRLKGELNSSRAQLSSMEQQLDRLREQLRAESVRAGLPALVTLPTGMTSSSMVPSSLPSQAAGVGAPSTVDQRLLENELVARKAYCDKLRLQLAQMEAMFRYLSVAQNDMDPDEDHACGMCPTCKRPFNTPFEREEAVTLLNEAKQELPQNIAQVKTQLEEAEKSLTALTNLRPLVLRVVEQEGVPLKELRDKVTTLQEQHAQEAAAARELSDTAAAAGDEAERAGRLVSESVWQVDRAAKEVAALKEEVTRLEAAAAQAAAGAGAGRTIADLDELIEQAENERATKELSRESTLKKQNRLKEELVALMRDQAEAREAFTSTKARADKKKELSDKINSLISESERLQREASQAESELSPLEGERQQKAEQRTRARAGMQAEEDGKEVELREVRALADQLAAKTRPIEDYELRNVEGQVTEAAANMKGTQDKIAALQQELASLEQLLSQRNQQVVESEATKRSMQDALDLMALEEQQKELQNQVTRLEAQQAEIGDVRELEGQLGGAQKEMTELVRQQDILRGSRQTQNEVKQRASAQLRVPQYENINLRYNRQYAEVMYLEMANADLEKYHKALEKALLSFHTTKMGDINKIIKELWQKTYRGQDIDYIQIKADADGARSYNYRVVMYSGGAELDMRGRCSAGQKVLACLIIRLALAETFCLNCGILALDEPTTNLDKENAESLAGALQQIMQARKGQENFQLIVITHDEDFARGIGTREHAEYLWRITKDETQHTHLEREEIDARE